MNLISDALSWIFAAEQWQGDGGLAALLGQHLLFTVLAVLIAGVIAIPAGWAIGHTGKGREIAVGIAGGLYAHQYGRVTAAVFDFNKSIEYLVMVVLGGMGSITGSIISASV